MPLACISSVCGTCVSFLIMRVLFSTFFSLPVRGDSGFGENGDSILVLRGDGGHDAARPTGGDAGSGSSLLDRGLL